MQVQPGESLGGSANVPRVNGSAAGGVLSLLLWASVVPSEQRPPSCEEGLSRCQTFVCPASSSQTNADEGIFWSVSSSVLRWAPLMQ